jgi:hypothetical protein
MKNEELISKLMVESMVLAPFNDTGTFDAIKFAELLIKECASIVDQRPNVLIGQTTGGWLREHFGVTEDE